MRRSKTKPKPKTLEQLRTQAAMLPPPGMYELQRVVETPHADARRAHWGFEGRVLPGIFMLTGWEGEVDATRDAGPRTLAMESFSSSVALRIGNESELDIMCAIAPRLIEAPPFFKFIGEMGWHQQGWNLRTRFLSDLHFKGHMSVPELRALAQRARGKTS